MEHEQRHVPKHAGQKQNLRDKLADNVDLPVEVLAVEEGDGDAKQHVDDPEDDGDLHLERVKEDDLIGGELPHGVDPEGVGGAVVTASAGVSPGGRVQHDGLLLQDVFELHRYLPGRSKRREMSENLKNKMRKS